MLRMFSELYFVVVGKCIVDWSHITFYQHYTCFTWSTRTIGMGEDRGEMEASNIIIVDRTKIFVLIIYLSIQNRYLHVSVFTHYAR